MYDELYNKLYKYMKEHVNEHRYRHTMGVVETAEKYARHFGADPDKARIAAVFHDACKGEGALAHGPAAAKLIHEKFGVDDDDIINAIKYHTVGRAGMSLLERVIKCADLTDPTRDYPNVDYFRNRLNNEDDINPVFLEMMYESRDIIQGRGEKPAKTSEECIAWLEEITKKETNG